MSEYEQWRARVGDERAGDEEFMRAVSMLDSVVAELSILREAMALFPAETVSEGHRAEVDLVLRNLDRLAVFRPL